MCGDDFDVLCSLTAIYIHLMLPIEPHPYSPTFTHKHPIFTHTHPILPQELYQRTAEEKAAALEKALLAARAHEGTSIYVCVYTYIYVHTYILTHIYTHTYLHTHTHSYPPHTHTLTHTQRMLLRGAYNRLRNMTLQRCNKRCFLQRQGQYTCICICSIPLFLQFHPCLILTLS